MDEIVKLEPKQELRGYAAHIAARILNQALSRLGDPSRYYKRMSIEGENLPQHLQI